MKDIPSEISDETKKSRKYRKAVKPSQTLEDFVWENDENPSPSNRGRKKGSRKNINVEKNQTEVLDVDRIESEIPTPKKKSNSFSKYSPSGQEIARNVSPSLPKPLPINLGKEKLKNLQLIDPGNRIAAKHVSIAQRIYNDQRYQQTLLDSRNTKIPETIANISSNSIPPIGSIAPPMSSFVHYGKQNNPFLEGSLPPPIRHQSPNLLPSPLSNRHFLQQSSMLSPSILLKYSLSCPVNLGYSGSPNLVLSSQNNHVSNNQISLSHQINIHNHSNERVPFGSFNGFEKLPSPMLSNILSPLSDVETLPQTSQLPSLQQLTQDLLPPPTTTKNFNFTASLFDRK